MKKNIFKLALAAYFIIVSTFLFINITLAAYSDNPLPDVAPIGATPDNKLQLQIPLFDYSVSSGLPEYIFNLFKYAIIIIIPLAIIMVMWGGIQWIAAAGNSQKIGAAKKQISSAFLGVILGLLTYTLLSFIGITQLYMPNIEKIEPMPAPVFDFEFDQPDTFNETANAGAPPTAGTMPRIFQCDYRNVKFNCSSKSVCSSGCGTVSVTMVLRYYGKNINIEQAVAFMGKGNYIGCSVNGTSPSGFAAIAKANSLNYEKVRVDFNTIKNYVAGGKPIIANVGNPAGCKKQPRSCKFTGCGHYIVLSGWDAANNRFIVNDPGGRAANRYNGTWSELTQGCVFKGAYYVGR